MNKEREEKEKDSEEKRKQRRESPEGCRCQHVKRNLVCRGSEEKLRRKEGVGLLVHASDIR